MKFVVLLTVVFLIVSCGVKRQDAGTSTATVVSFNGFSGGEQNDITDAIEDLNSGLNTTLVEPSSNETGYPISFSIFYSTALDSRVGYARRKVAGCDIQLSDLLFNEREDLLKWVVWHEIGHCYGLNHSSNPASLMHSTTGADYEGNAIAAFLDRLLNAAGI